jgi:hypothetical protein
VARDCAADTFVILFAGPSAWGLDPALLETAGLTRRPPVRRGDIDRLLAQAEPPATVIVCDGVFHAEPPVSHAELCRALDAGVRIWGVSSIGAIRAYELRDDGMRGYGDAYAMFERFDDFTDDELCLLHFPEPPYFPVSEALVNVRHALERQGPALGISLDQADIVIDRLRALWFGDRTCERLRHVLTTDAAIDAHEADLLIAWISRHPVKTSDLERLLRLRPWESPIDGDRTP